MAPLHLSKKFNHSSVTENVTCEQLKNLRGQGNDESEDINSCEDIEAMETNDEGQDEEPEETQSTSAQALLSNMVAGARKRHTARKKNVIESYDCTAMKIRESINTLFDEHEEKSLSDYEAQMKRLKELLAHKAKIEAAMEAILTLLRGSYDAHSRDLETVLNRRIQELK